MRLERKGKDLRLVAVGRWTIGDAVALDTQLKALDVRGAGRVDMDASGLAALDSAGAWLLLRTKRQLEAAGAKVQTFTVPEAYQPLLETLSAHEAPPVEMPPPPSLNAFFERVGRGSWHVVCQGYDMLGFLGRVVVESAEIVVQPGSLRIKAWIHQMNETGVTALPILGLLSFLIGVVIAYQGADQLKKFGAEVFTINLLGVSILRELGGLIAAIIIAGRSGSAFTAQIGTMKVNQEIDAMQTLGLNVVEVLVLPRVLGLMITLPILTLYSDFMGLLGGAIMCYFYLDLSIPVFLRQLSGAITMTTVWVGLIKAPFFAAVIALVGCFEGLQVEGNAASVGRLTTRAVVESIFLVIVFDAAFSILFSILGV